MLAVSIWSSCKRGNADRREEDAVKEIAAVTAKIGN